MSAPRVPAADDDSSTSIRTITRLVDTVCSTIKATTSRPVSWRWATGMLTDLFIRYPAGLSTTAILAELQSNWAQVEGQWKLGAMKNKCLGASHILQLRRAPYDGIFEVTLVEVTQLNGTQTRLFSFCDVAPDLDGGFEETEQEATADPGPEGPAAATANTERTVQAFLHQKYHGFLESLVVAGRTVRMTGCRVVIERNTPRVLPTPYMLPVLYPGRSQSDRLITDTFATTTLKHLKSDDIGGSGHIRLLCTVTYRGVVKALKRQINQNGDEYGPLRSRRVLLTDGSTQQPVTLALYDDQVMMVDLFQQGDFLAIDNPRLVHDNDEHSGSVVLEWGVLTMISVVIDRRVEVVPFALNSEPALGSLTQASRPSQMVVTRDDQGTRDFSYVLERLYISDLRPHVTNAAVLCRVESVECSTGPSSSETRGGKRTVYWTVGDHTGSIKVELVAHHHPAVLEVLVGHVVFLEAVDVGERGGKTVAQCRLHDPGALRNLTTACGRMAPEALTALEGVLSLPGSWADGVVRGVVTSFRSNDAKGNRICYPSSIMCHRSCMRDLTHAGGVMRCTLCGETNVLPCDRRLAFHAHVTIDDGTAVVEATTTPVAMERLMMMDPAEYRDMNPGARAGQARSVLGRDFYFAVSRVPKGTKGAWSWRVEAVAAPNDDFELARDLSSVQ